MKQLNDAEKAEVLELLRTLVGIDSAAVDPEAPEPPRTEERIAAFLADYLHAMGMSIQTYELAPGRPSLVAHWPDQGSASTVAFEAHMDTVTTAGMTIDPFAAEVHDGRVWGRGTCDTKGSLAAMLVALKLARRADALPNDRILFVAAANEENGCQGARHLVEEGFRADAAIIGEPTRCQIVTAHKGPLWLRVDTHGRSAHASMPQLGLNAIETMAEIVRYVHGPWVDQLRQGPHPLLGESTAQVTQITGGAKTNIIPASCRIEIDARLVPGCTPQTAENALSAGLAELLGDPACFTITRMTSQPSLNTDPERPFVRRMMALCREANGQATPLGVNYFADSGPFSEAGIPSLVFGPGDIAQAHTADEHLELDQLFEATEILLTLLTQHAHRSILS